MKYVILCLLLCGCANMPHKKWDDTTKFLFSTSVAVQCLDAANAYELTRDDRFTEGNTIIDAQPSAESLILYILVTTSIKYFLTDIMPEKYRNAVPSFFIGANTANLWHNETTRRKR